jgi:hypothetical protein
MQQHNVGVPGADLVERHPDRIDIVAVAAAGEGDAGAGRSENLGVGTAARGDKFPAVDDRGGEGAVIGFRAAARPPRRAGVGLGQRSGIGLVPPGKE